MTGTAWMMRALCRNYDPDIWFSTYDREQRRAIAICNACPVKALCLEYALELPAGTTSNGVWAGRTYYSIRGVRARRNGRKEDRHVQESPRLAVDISDGSYSYDSADDWRDEQR